MRLTPDQIHAIQSTVQTVLGTSVGLSFAALVGSRAQGREHPGSDWDIAIRWNPVLGGTDKLVATEELRQQLRHALNVSEDRVDLIDLADARLAMRTLVAEEGVPLYFHDDLTWIRFLQNTWAQIEDNQWRSQHAA